MAIEEAEYFDVKVENGQIILMIQERSLAEIIEDMQQQAESNGLTAEILAEILKDD